jgi:pimeloyl-ACP methyl ester carboxylesterase
MSGRRDTERFERLMLGVAIVAVGVAGALVGAGTTADRITRPKGVPATPAGEQLAWVLAQLNGGASALSSAAVDRHFSPRFLAEVAPAPQVVELLRQTAAERGPFRFVGFARPPRANMVVAVVRTGDGTPAAVRVETDGSSPSRILNLEVGAAPPEVTPSGPHSGNVDIGGRQLFLRCIGDGDPTVVLEGGTTEDWFELQNRLSGHTRLCSYDRANAPWGRSDPASTPRTARDVVDDLHALLGNAEVPGPYVLVGHSNGGLFAQLYAHLHPDEVAGLVLLDAVHVDYTDRRLALFESVNGGPTPDGPSSASRPVFIDPGQRILLDASQAQVREARQASPLRPMPLFVLSHGKPNADELPLGSIDRADEELWRELQRELAALVPGARHAVAENAGHDIAADQPEAVVDATLQVVTAVRHPSIPSTEA